jgi:hypothetical protein
MIFLLLNLILQFIACISGSTVQNEFKLLKNQDVNATVRGIFNNVISKVNIPGKWLCIASCNLNQEYACVVYDKRNGLTENCFLYNRFFISSEKIESSTSTMYEKLNSYFYLFKQGVNNEMLKNNSVIQTCLNLDKVTINSFQYNLLVDQSVGVYWYDSNWNYQSTFNMPNIFYGIVAKGFFYFSTFNSANGIVKTTLNSSTAIKSYGISSVYRGLFYDSMGS